MTPFELRLQLLNMAKDLLVEDYHGNKNADEQAFHAKMEIYRESRSTRDKPEFPKPPAFPTEQEIIAKAKILNDFISNG